MKKFKKCLLIVLLIACFAMPLFTGCDFLISSSSKLKTPVVTISESNKSLTWSEISGADGYAIYCNDKLADEIEATENSKAMYDYSATLTETGKYSYYVIATTSNIRKQNSEKSNVCETNYTKKILISPDAPEADIQDENEITFTINDGVISYLPLDIENIEYEVYLYSNSSGLKTYTLSNTVLNLKQGSYLTKDEIYAIRLGYSYGSGDAKKHVIASDIKYYNPDSYSPYTDQIYMFDGYINDYYIENIQELSNIVYYSFIYRLETFNIRISDEFKDFISKAFGYSTTTDNLDFAIDYGFDQLYETIAYQANNTNGGFSSQNGSPNEFTIKISYGGVKECDTTISPSLSAIYPQGRTTGYYDTVNYETLKEKYGDTYDEFVSDKQFLYTSVTTSEELYWAVENKVTPIFEKTNTRAYTIYEKAKQVLREIISDEMTDYEKALSIFDWIAINSSYDYTSYTKSNGYSSSVANYPTYLPCFYLEGVFMTGYSVCDGFSKSYSLLCNMIGVDCIRIVGDAGTLESKGGHAWNKVLFDKDPTDDVPAKYYLVDITWTELISGDHEEALSHTYFGLSDEQVKDNHFPHKNREVKFSKYASGESLDYYSYQTFDYKGTKENLVIENTQELQDAFDYLLINAYDTLEIVVDYDYMVSEYNKNGNYLSQTGVEKEYYDASDFSDRKTRIKSEYDKATDTLTFYSYTPVYSIFGITGYTQQSVTYLNYELRNSFQINVMKKAKFQEQYLFIVDDNGLMEYEAGKKGMLFVFTQNLLIDNIDANGNSTNEVAHLVEYFSDNKITGTFVLYVENPILNEATGTTATQKVQSLFGSALSTADVEMSFKLVSDDAQTGSASASIFNLVVTEKTA